MTVIFDICPPAPDRRELLRYAGAKGEPSDMSSLVDSVIAEASGVFDYRICAERLPVMAEDGSVRLGQLLIPSQDLQKNLSVCNEAVIFTATVGSGIDRLINRYSRISPARALLLQAYGAERIEALCDAFCSRIASETTLALRPRFSPGYGDLPLELQKDIFALLDCERKIGLTLNGSLLMSPTKSVSAIVGLYKRG